MAEPARPFAAVIFDLDGTLLESRIDFDGLRRSLRVPEGSFILDWIENLPDSLRADAHRVLDRFEREAAESASILPGVSATLDWLRSALIPFGILTRNSRTSWETVRSRFPFLEPDLVVTRIDGPAKPSPECVHPFLDRWRAEGNRLVHVGDYRFDLEIAEVWGMHSILIREEGVNPYDIACHRVVRDHRELLGYLKSLPFR